jgi:TolB-like protein
VLPFKYADTNAELTALVDGITDDIVTGLSRFSYLRVIARSSTLHYGHSELTGDGPGMGELYERA